MQRLDPIADGESYRLQVRLPEWLRHRLFKAVPEQDRPAFIRDAISEAVAEKLGDKPKRRGKSK